MRLAERTPRLRGGRHYTRRGRSCSSCYCRNPYCGLEIRIHGARHAYDFGSQNWPQTPGIGVVEKCRHRRSKLSNLARVDTGSTVASISESLLNDGIARRMREVWKRRSRLQKWRNSHDSEHCARISADRDRGPTELKGRRRSEQMGR